MRRAVIVAALAAAAFAAAASAASSSVRLVSITTPVSAGSNVTLTVAVSPAQTCSITVTYKSGPSHAAGLSPKRGRRISWTWKVGSRTTVGRWPVVVSCGPAGTLRTSFVVR